MTYKIIKFRDYDGMQCLKCGHITFNPYELQNRYCGNCDISHENYIGLIALTKQYVDVKLEESPTNDPSLN
jgi:uncharacterized OB-fold protein